MDLSRSGQTSATAPSVGPASEDTAKCDAPTSAAASTLGQLRQPKLIVFDLDGTLVDTSRTIVEAARRLRVRRHLAPLTWGDIRRMLGAPTPDVVARIIGTSAEDPSLPDLLQQYGLEYQAALSRSVPFPGVPMVLDELRNGGIATAVCTNKSYGLARATLTAVGLEEFFPDGLVVGSDSLPWTKPDPRMLSPLLGLSGVPPTACWMVGDDDVDVCLARAASATSVFCTYGFGALREVADIRIGAMTELLSLLARCA